MADDMANGNDDAHRQYPDPFQGAMGERVTNMGRRINDVEVEMRSGFNQINQSISALSNTLAERNKTQWPVIFLAIGVASSVLGYFVTQALTPIRDANLDMKAAIIQTSQDIKALAASTVSQQELAWRSQRGVEDRTRMETAIGDIRAALVPRQEHERVWTSYDQRFADIQRQVDEVKAAQTSVYNQRDVVRDILERLDRAEHRPPPAP